MFNASRIQRVFFFNMGVLSLTGLWLTGFEQVHWFAYLVPGGLFFAAATGLCLGMITATLLVRVLGLEEKPAGGQGVPS